MGSQGAAGVGGWPSAPHLRGTTELRDAMVSSDRRAVTGGSASVTASSAAAAAAMGAAVASSTAAAPSHTAATAAVAALTTQSSFSHGLPHPRHPMQHFHGTHMYPWY